MKIEPMCPDCDCTQFDIEGRRCFCAGCGGELLPDGYVYIMKSEEVPEPFSQRGNAMYKVGRSKDPERRLREHKSRLWLYDLVLIHTIPTNNMKEAEREIHVRLEKQAGALNIRGEWYILDAPALNGLKFDYVFCQEYHL